MDNWKVKIIDVGYKTTLDVYIFQDAGIGKINILRGDIVETVDDGVKPSPSLVVSREVLQAFAEALNEKGINAHKEFIEGKLQATERHLTDMRTLLKLK